jgi:hypothetical protein
VGCILLGVYGDIRLVIALGGGALNMACTDPHGCTEVFTEEVGEIKSNLSIPWPLDLDDHSVKRPL